MKWKKITINTLVEAADIVASVLFDNGIVGAEIEDNQNLTTEELKKMYVDIPKLNVDDGKSKVSFYVSIGEKVNKDYEDNNLVDSSYMVSNDNIFTESEFENILSSIKDELEDYKFFMDMGTLVFEEEILDDKDFLTKWKENFKSIKIDNINILPSWEKQYSEDDINIFIEPGNAFGTGQHETTRLCALALKDIIKNGDINSFLDIGAGSGILSLIAYKLGAKKVYAIDIDENCEFNLLENLKLNRINSYKKITSENSKINEYNDKFVYGFGNIITDDWLKNSLRLEKYDIIVANILAPVIISLIEKADIASYLNDGGYLVLSGIIKEKENDVRDALMKNSNIKDIKVNSEGEWVSIVCHI